MQGDRDDPFAKLLSELRVWLGENPPEVKLSTFPTSMVGGLMWNINTLSALLEREYDERLGTTVDTADGS